MVPLAPIESFYKIMWAAFWINALSGTALLIADATTKLTNPVCEVEGVDRPKAIVRRCTTLTTAPPSVILICITEAVRCP